MMPRFRSILFIFRGSKRERNKTERKKEKEQGFPSPQDENILHAKRLEKLEYKE